MAKELNELVYELRVTERQMNIIKSALDVYCRLRLGQITNALWSVFTSREVDHDKFDAVTRELKQVVFPELFFNSSYGVGWMEGNNSLNSAQIAYEIEAQIDYLKIKASGEERPMNCRSSPPLHYSPETLVELRKIEFYQEK